MVIKCSFTVGSKIEGDTDIEKVTSLSPMDAGGKVSLPNPCPNTSSAEPTRLKPKTKSKTSKFFNFTQTKTR